MFMLISCLIVCFYVYITSNNEQMQLSMLFLYHARDHSRIKGHADIITMYQNIMQISSCLQLPDKLSAVLTHAPTFAHDTLKSCSSDEIPLPHWLKHIYSVIRH